MNPQDHPAENKDTRWLVRHLGVVVALKLMMLAALWWFFVRDSVTDIDAQQAAARLATTNTEQGASK